MLILWHYQRYAVKYTQKAKKPSYTDIPTKAIIIGHEEHLKKKLSQVGSYTTTELQTQLVMDFELFIQNKYPK